MAITLIKYRYKNGSMRNGYIFSGDLKMCRQRSFNHFDGPKVFINQLDEGILFFSHYRFFFFFWFFLGFFGFFLF